MSLVSSLPVGVEGLSRAAEVLGQPGFLSFPRLPVLLPWVAAGGLEGIGSVPQWVLSVGGMEFRFNVIPLVMSWLVMAFWVLVAWLGTRNLKEKPGALQTVLELIVGAFDDLCRDTLGKRGRQYMPLVATLFLFIVVSNITMSAP